MEILEVKLNLGALNKAVVVKNSKKRKAILIPFDDNFVFEGEKGVYLSLNAFEMKDVKFNSTHLLKLKIPSEIYKAMSDDEKKSMPIVGSIDKFTSECQNVQQIEVQSDDFSDLPF